MWTAPFIFGIAAVHTAPAYIISRFFIGWALAAFVTCQFWTSIMFSPNVVGFANALAGGWGNAGMSRHAWMSCMFTWLRLQICITTFLSFVLCVITWLTCTAYYGNVT